MFVDYTVRQRFGATRVGGDGRDAPPLQASFLTNAYLEPSDLLA